MSWHTPDLRAEIVAEFDAWAQRLDWCCDLYHRARFYYRAVWQRDAIACRMCSTTFTPIDRRRLFCSERCKSRHRKSHAPVACKSCGAVFTPLDAHRLYCSQRCKGRYHSTRSLAAWRQRQAAVKQAQCEGRICINPRCGRVFTAKRIDARYCEPACRLRRSALRYVHKHKELHA